MSTMRTAFLLVLGLLVCPSVIAALNPSLPNLSADNRLTMLVMALIVIVLGLAGSWQDRHFTAEDRSQLRKWSLQFALWAGAGTVVGLIGADGMLYFSGMGDSWIAHHKGLIAGGSAGGACLIANANRRSLFRVFNYLAERKQ